MRLILLVFAAIAPIVAGVSSAPGSARADAGPHGSYELNTSACAACHRAHTAPAAELLLDDSVYGLCVSCHGGLTQTNVVDGVRTGDNARLNGGGFEFLEGEAITSTHTVNGLPGGDLPQTAWGGASSGAGVTGVLECTSCHNPHGSTNYRILRDSDNGYPYTDANCGDVPGCAADAHKWVPDEPDLLVWGDEQVLGTVDDDHDYAVGDSAYYTSGMDYDPGTKTTTVDATKGMTAFCSTCHKQYLTKSGSAGHPSTDAAYYFYPGTQDAQDGLGDIPRYRHAVAWVWDHQTGGSECLTCHSIHGPDADQAVRFAATSAPGEDPVTHPRYNGVQCLTCHFAHGTNAEAGGYSFDVAPTGDSALLYHDNRGVCMTCHPK